MSITLDSLHNESLNFYWSAVTRIARERSHVDSCW